MSVRVGSQWSVFTARVRVSVKARREGQWSVDRARVRGSTRGLVRVRVRVRVRVS